VHPGEDATHGGCVKNPRIHVLPDVTGLFKWEDVLVFWCFGVLVFLIVEFFLLILP
jgi:hypothetical protein